MIKTLKYLALIVLTALACYGIFSVYSSFFKIKSVDKVSSDIILQRVEKVFKLVTVEGNFSEIYNYENHIFADMWPFRKKALVQVSARVSVGYNFDSVILDVDETKRIITLKGTLQPEILSIDHDVKSYDFENGLFNMINDRDIRDMGFEAKQFIREKAENSDLLQQAEEQKTELIEMLKWVLKAADWDFRLEGETLLN